MTPPKRRGWSWRSRAFRGLVYQVLDEDRTVKVIRMWTHYE